MALTEYIIDTCNAADFTGAGTHYTIQANNGDLYIFYIDSLTDVAYMKSTDKGVSLGNPVVLVATTATQLAYWYDRWSGIATDLVCLAYTESVGNDTIWATFNTATDILGTAATVHAGTSAAGGGALSICRSRGGNVYIKTCIDAGAEGGFYKCLNANVGGTNAVEAALTDSEALATADQWILMPGWAADTNDMAMFFWDASAEEISLLNYDDSGNTWAETARTELSIATSMTDTVASTDYPHFAAAVDTANSRNLLVAWSARDTLNADLRCWHVADRTVTEVTNVVQNSTDDQGFAAIGINTDTQDWYVVFAGKADGSETMGTNVTLNYKVSTDDGAIWGVETPLSTRLRLRRSVWTIPRFSGSLVSHGVYEQSSGGARGVAVAVNIPTGSAHVIGG